MWNADSVLSRATVRAESGLAPRARNAAYIAIDAIALASSLREAIARNEFYLAFQPIVRLASGRLTRLEALLRWNNPMYGVVGPEIFIPIAEQIGIIDEISEWVVRACCQQLKCWESEFGLRIPVSINVSSHQLRRAEFAAEVRDIVDALHCDPRDVEIEVTESAFIEDIDLASRVLHELAAAGMRIAVDDFGSGNTSICYLRNFPIHHIKLDRSLICSLDSNPRSLAIVRAIAGLGRELDIAVTAEGVETTLQRNLLNQFRCIQAQGYLFSPPQSPAAISAWLCGSRDGCLPSLHI